MLLGGALSLVGALYPSKKNQNDGELHIKLSKLKVFVRGSIRFALVMVGGILIIGAAFDGFQSEEKYYPKGYSDIGVSFQIHDKRVWINSIIDGGLTHQIGMKCGDEIVEVNNVSLQGKFLNEVEMLFQKRKVCNLQIVIERDGIRYSYILPKKEYSILDKLAK